jgi:hypothetical protein
MIKTLRWFILCLLFPSVSYAQLIHEVIGADAHMQGRISSVINGAFAVVNNPSQMSWNKNWQMGLYNEQRYFIKQLRLSNISVVVPTKIIDVGASISYYGFEDFNQQRYTVSASKKINQNLSIGVQLNSIHTNINHYGNVQTFVIGGGLTYKPTDRILLGFTIYNPNQKKISSNISDDLPTYARFGMEAKISNKVYTLLEVEQILNETLTPRAAIRYEPHKRVRLAIGFSGHPTVFNYGAGLKISQFIIDMSASTNPRLGSSYQLSLRFPNLSDKN